MDGPLDPRRLGLPERLRRLQELRDELLRSRCRTSLLAFATHVLAAKGEVPARHHRLMVRSLEDVTHSRTPRLILISPRGSADGRKEDALSSDGDRTLS